MAPFALRASPHPQRQATTASSSVPVQRPSLSPTPPSSGSARHALRVRRFAPVETKRPNPSPGSRMRSGQAGLSGNGKGLKIRSPRPISSGASSYRLTPPEGAGGAVVSRALDDTDLRPCVKPQRARGSRLSCPALEARRRRDPGDCADRPARMTSWRKLVEWNGRG